MNSPAGASDGDPGSWILPMGPTVGSTDARSLDTTKCKLIIAKSPDQNLGARYAYGKSWKSVLSIAENTRHGAV